MRGILLASVYVFGSFMAEGNWLDSQRTHISVRNNNAPVLDCGGLFVSLGPAKRLASAPFDWTLPNVSDPDHRLRFASSGTIEALSVLLGGHRASVLAGGAESLIVVREPRAVGGDAIKIAYSGDSRVRAAYAQEARIIELLGSRFGGPGSDAFTRVVGYAEMNGIPVIRMRYSAGGSLFDRLSDLGAQAGYNTLSEVFRQTAIPLKYLHTLQDGATPGYAHNDVKPSNYLVEGGGPLGGRYEFSRIRLADLGFASPLGGRAPGGDPGGPSELDVFISPNYARPIRHFRRLFGNTPEIIGGVERDMYAHMVTLQEILLGKPLGAVADGCDTDSTTHLKLPNWVLKRSPHSMDPRVPETLSTISWTEFKSAGAFLNALDRANRDQDQTDRFYSQYYGPQILSQLTLRQAAQLIHTDRALESRLSREGALGLDGSVLEALRREIERIRVEDLRGSILWGGGS